MAQMTLNRELYFSQLLGKPIYDAAGRKVGRVQDMAVHWEGAYPQVVGIKYARKVRNLIPIDQLQHCDRSNITLAENFTWEQTVPLEENAIYISKWLLDKQIIDLQGVKFWDMEFLSVCHQHMREE